MSISLPSAPESKYCNLGENKERPSEVDGIGELVTVNEEENTKPLHTGGSAAPRSSVKDGSIACLDFDPFDFENIPLPSSSCCCGAVGGFRVSRRCVINAPPQAVWKAIIEGEHYDKWNPFHRHVTTTMEIGTPYMMKLDMTLSGRAQKYLPSFTEIIRCLDHSQRVFVYSERSCMTASNRVQVVLSLDNGTRSEYVTVDAIGGCTAWLTRRIFEKKLYTAFEAQTQALRNYVETGKRLSHSK